MRNTEDSIIIWRLEIEGAEELAQIPADEFLKRCEEPKVQGYLTWLMFSYARYLLISSSYGCALPANLQGIWNGSFTPPWESGYTININLQMNYWMQIEQDWAYAMSRSST